TGAGTDEVLQVSRLELVGLADEALQIGEPEVVRPGGEEVSERDRRERRVPAGARAPDRHPGGVDVAAVDEELGARHAVVGGGGTCGGTRGRLARREVLGVELRLGGTSKPLHPA